MNNEIKLQDKIRKQAYQKILEYLKEDPHSITDSNLGAQAMFALRILESTILTP